MIIINVHSEDWKSHITLVHSKKESKYACTFTCIGIFGFISHQNFYDRRKKKYFIWKRENGLWCKTTSYKMLVHFSVFIHISSKSKKLVGPFMKIFGKKDFFIDILESEGIISSLRGFVVSFVVPVMTLGDNMKPFLWEDKEIILFSKSYWISCWFISMDSLRSINV